MVMIYYVNTSVLVKRHVAETGRNWVRSITHPATGNTIFTAQISLVELYSALNRRLREKSISGLRYSRLASIINFLSADTRLLVAAQAEGFTTDDPNLH